MGATYWTNSVLDPGVIPEIKGVTKFPAHEYISGVSKIPTITVYYDSGGNVKALGAEAEEEGIYEIAEHEHWVKAEWFKLHLRSQVGAGNQLPNIIPPLPLNKTVVEVFADFLAYLLECALRYIQDHHANGEELWASIKNQIYFVPSHPNGWEGSQQAKMRKAAVLAKLIPDTTAGRSRLSFVTEGEASLHFSVKNGLPIGVMEGGEGVVIVDAGGGTIDISSYAQNIAEADKRFGEVSPPQGHFHGSVFVTTQSRLFLENYLEDSEFLEDLDHIVGCFDKTTKLRFRNSNEPQYIKFGGAGDNDPNCNIRFGQLKLLGSDVAKFFEPSVECIVKGVLDQCKVAHKPISHVILVGGFAASDWLFNQVRDKLLPHGLNIIRPENHVNKDVSDGALSFYHDRFVRTRVSKFTYGCFFSRSFDPTDLDHLKRLHNAFKCSLSGGQWIRDSFDVILPKNTPVSETKEFRKTYRWISESKDDFKVACIPVSCYRGAVVTPQWKDIDTQNYTELCRLEVDLSQLPVSRRNRPSRSGTYYRVNCDIVLLFGLTELEAVAAWRENGVERRSTARVIYDPDESDLTDDP